MYQNIAIIIRQLYYNKISFIVFVTVVNLNENLATDSKPFQTGGQLYTFTSPNRVDIVREYSLPLKFKQFGGRHSSVSGFVYVYHSAIPGSNPKHTIYTYSIYSQILCYICHRVLK